MGTAMVDIIDAEATLHELGEAQKALSVPGKGFYKVDNATKGFLYKAEHEAVETAVKLQVCSEETPAATFAIMMQLQR